MNSLTPYMHSILNACLLFLPVAALFTLPFMIVQYHRYGSIPVLRALVVYAFILYMMCAYLLTVLPLPTYDEVLARPNPGIQYKLFSSYADAFKNAGFSFSQLSSWKQLANWKALLHSSGLFEILANIVMQIPLGIFLRYYFRRSWKQTLLIGLCVSLFYELTQLSGLYFIYPKPYRLCSVDDLFDNTLGAMIGFWITPLICALLPSREELDRISIEKGRRVTIMRRVTAAIIDWLIFAVLYTLALLLNGPLKQLSVIFCTFGYFIWVALVFIVGQRIFHGKTVGKALLRISVISRDTQSTPQLWQLFVRYCIIYLLMPIVLICVIGAMMCLGAIILSGDATWRAAGIVGLFLLLAACGFIIFRSLHKNNELPHSHVSRTTIITHPRRGEIADTLKTEK